VVVALGQNQEPLGQVVHDAPRDPARLAGESRLPLTTLAVQRFYDAGFAALLGADPVQFGRQEPLVTASNKTVLWTRPWVTLRMS
jgi:hypothetical protein